MKNFTPIEYICIDIANAYGLDKELFEDRIQWVKDNAKNLESLAQEADDYPIYMKADTQEELPSELYQLSRDYISFAQSL